MKRSLPRTSRLVAALAVLALGAGLATGHAALPQCPMPIAFPAGDTVTPDGESFFSAADRSTIGWEAEQSGGFRIQWSTSPSLDSQTGEFASPAGSDSTTASKREKAISGLQELTYHYHVRAKAKTGVCTASKWSNIVTITQDATAPTVTITNEPAPLGPTPVTPPMPIYLLQDSIRITGTSQDVPGPAVDAAAGALLVVVTLQNTTPGLGASSEPLQQVAFVDTDGSWLADFTGLGLGTYTVAAIGFDIVGNEMAEPETLEFIAINP